MTNVSKSSLSEATHKKLFTQFTNIFIAADEKKLAVLFDAVFTDAEKIMYIKRVAIILMLSKNISMYAISKSLGVSETTVRRQRDLYESGRYDILTGVTRNKSFDWEGFFGVVEILLRGGMPSYGKDRWKSL